MMVIMVCVDLLDVFDFGICNSFSVTSTHHLAFTFAFAW